MKIEKLIINKYKRFRELKESETSWSIMMHLGINKIKKTYLYYFEKYILRFISLAMFYRYDKIISEKIEEKEEINCYLNNTIINNVIEKIRAEYIESIRGYIFRADTICDHKYSFLSDKESALGETINWHLDFVNNYTWPYDYSKDIKKIDPQNESDIKIPWELSRLQHFVTLGQAYRLTEDEKYCKEYIRQFLSWNDNNRCNWGINWINAMEAAIRAANLIVSFYLFKKSKYINKKFLKIYFRSLMEHGYFIQRNLEIRKIIQNDKIFEYNGNHYLADLVGLIYIGLFFHRFKKGRNWLSFGLNKFFKEILQQTNRDGVNYEFSIGYHRLVTEFTISVINLCKNNNIYVPEKVNLIAQKQIEFVKYYTKPNGLCPLIGDFDNGRLFIFTNIDINDHRYLLKIGKCLFLNSCTAIQKEMIEHEELWMTGSIDNYNGNKDENCKITSSYAFEDSGYYILRSESNYLIMSAHGIGIKGTGGSHTHNDFLSFEMSVKGEDLFIDSGSYTYSGNFKERNFFRCTAAHNTISIDKQEINRIEEMKIFDITNDASIAINKWSSNEDFDVFIGQHDGFSRLKGNVLHQRAVLYSKKQIYWLISDRLLGSGEHLSQTRFHLSPKVEIQNINKNLLKLKNGDAIVYFYFLGEKYEMHIIDDWVSFGYGQKEKNKTILVSTIRSLPYEFNYLISSNRLQQVDIQEIVLHAQSKIIT